MKKLNSFYVTPGYTFFYWGFTIPKSEYPILIKYFRFKSNNLIKDIVIHINNKRYPAKIRLARITTKRFPNRKVVQVYYDTEYDTLKALRNMFIYSYASTIEKSKSNLKEVLEFVHLFKNEFKINPITRQKTDFDEMFRAMESKNLFAYWKDRKKNPKEKLFINWAPAWIEANGAKKFATRSNVIYILFNKKHHNIYVGKADIFGKRVKEGEGRIGFHKNWDKFMYFELNPKYAHFLKQIESFTIKVIASLMDNYVGTKPIGEKIVELVNHATEMK